MIFLLVLVGLPLLFLVIDFSGFLIKGERVVNIILIRAMEIEAFLILPYIYISLGDKNDCCGDSAAFSPEHQLTIWVMVALCLVAYFYSSYRIKIATPILEMIVNGLLLFGLVLNIFIAIQTKDIFLAALGNLPIILSMILILVKNQKLFIAQYRDFIPENKFQNIIWRVLNLQPLLKFPVIFILCLPVIIFITAILLLAGQKPDSIIKAFTDTYKHGFSQWDYKCDNVQCGGHYLCSVAAKGHKEIVKPQRLGFRNGGYIICNRQLLISNAFEELIQESAPFIHKLIRTPYNKVGILIHRYYSIFNIKWVSDFIYILMKPLEWFFLLMLYTFDRKPENRIAKQYVSVSDRQEIDNWEISVSNSSGFPDTTRKRTGLSS